jgi:hypothetical protein
LGIENHIVKFKKYTYKNDYLVIQPTWSFVFQTEGQLRNRASMATRQEAARENQRADLNLGCPRTSPWSTGDLLGR